MGEKLKRYALIIKHPGRDWDYRVDIVWSESAEKAREKAEANMLGPFQVLAVAHRLSDPVGDRNADEAGRVIGELREEVTASQEMANGIIKEYDDRIVVLEADRKLLRRLIATMREGADEMMEEVFEEVEALHGRLDRDRKISYKCGYQAGHNDTVEACFSLDHDTMADEWLTDATDDGTFPPLDGVEGLRGEVDGLKSVLAAVAQTIKYSNGLTHAGVVARIARDILPGSTCPGCVAKDRQLERAREAWEEIREDYLIGVSWPDPLASKMDAALNAKTFDNPSGVYDAALATKEEVAPPKGRVIAEVDEVIWYDLNMNEYYTVASWVGGHHKDGALVTVTVRERKEPK